MITGITPHFIILIICTNIFFGTPQATLAQSLELVATFPLFQQGIEELVRGEYTEAIYHLSQVIQYQDNFAPAYSHRV
ncbi:hypothetical protein IQ230_16500 [Gloeocapsopsis crepidinum LEGE 06123]|uniref:Tetratricopeptide repeat protein n=1 Tax=Gloeocapsopsis crepidinum LEGE 06123 TaxID=588587 RepID=A0ABR9UUE2_9CHRO|nr:hypothetical protein [Gloeocapsopsis crepidinum]MBE9191922.1 hypothetical protein [Gloeocapsopsis crepidinum LEGE 06123]